MQYVRSAVLGLFAFLVLALGLVALAAVLVIPTLPSLEALTDYRPKVPLRIYTADGALIGEFGAERRALVRIQDVPLKLRQAIIAAEDERFYSHGGVDTLGVLRAALANLSAGGAREGASTITMQVARNFFLTREKTLTRKFSEALLAIKIEHYLTKDQILELYVNQIYLGQRSYGFASAAQTYYDKGLDDLDLSEIATLAGLPKAPSAYNPVANPPRAKTRQLYVLRRMHELGFVTDAELQAARAAPIVVNRPSAEMTVAADYLAEMVRQAMFERYQDEAYTEGFSVYTTILSGDQKAANEAVRAGVLAYDARHGYRGPEAYVELPEVADTATLDEALADRFAVQGLLPAVVTAASPKAVSAYLASGERVKITGEGLAFARAKLKAGASAKTRIRRGAIIRVRAGGKAGAWKIAQLPAVEAGLIALDPQTNAVRALVGGFSFARGKFNHVTQALRQPGSSFKPFIYSAALEKGFTPATVINDAPVVLDSRMTGGKLWQPKNFDETYAGPIRLREALVRSKNLVSIRILQTIGIPYARDYLARFGFEARKLPPYMPLALGAGEVTPYEMAAAYSVFANGGYYIKPYYIQRIVDARGRVLAMARPVRAGAGAERVIDPRNAYLMTSMMRDVVKRGTGARVAELGRSDLAGKTGTTNDQLDAWFAGFQPGLVAVVWIGFDEPRSLGAKETGAQAALPIWMSFMRKALDGVPVADYAMPEGLVALRVSAASGLRTSDGDLTEYFYEENLPPVAEERDTLFGGDDAAGGDEDYADDAVKDQLF